MSKALSETFMKIGSSELYCRRRKTKRVSDQVVGVPALQQRIVTSACEQSQIDVAVMHFAINECREQFGSGGGAVRVGHKSKVSESFVWGVQLGR